MGDAINPAVEIPNSDATGLAQTPMQAPLLQKAKKRGIIELMLPVMDVQMDFILFIVMLI